MKKDLGSELEAVDSKVKNLINLFSEVHQKMQSSIREIEILTERNRKEINYLTAQINYNFSK